MLLFRCCSSVLSRGHQGVNSLPFEGNIGEKISHGLLSANITAYRAELSRLENMDGQPLGHPLPRHGGFGLLCH